VAEWVFARFTRVTGTNTDEEERSEVYNVRWPTSAAVLTMKDSDS
jgi:hypothetical protein